MSHDVSIAMTARIPKDDRRQKSESEPESELSHGSHVVPLTFSFSESEELLSSLLGGLCNMMK